MGFPIYAFGDKQIYEYAWLKRAKFIDLATTILQATLADIETVIVELLNGLLNNVNFTFDDTKWPGMNATALTGVPNLAPVNVTRLANADGSVGSVWAYGQEILLASLNHYLVSGTSQPTAANFATIRSTLRNVGNDADIIYIVNRADADYIASNFTAGTDFVPPVEILNTQLSQDLFGKYANPSQYGMLGTGIRTRGRILSALGELVEFPHWPQGYIGAFDRTKEPPLRWRESDMADERGLQLATPDNKPVDVQTNPLLGKHWRRIFGIGARNRTNGVVMQITTNGSYTAPSLT